jgi:hypothetical protein
VQAFWDDGSPIRGVDLSVSPTGEPVWSVEAEFSLTALKSKQAAKGIVQRLQHMLPGLPDSIEKQSARDLMLYRDYGLAHLIQSMNTSELYDSLGAVICLVSNDLLLAEDAKAWRLAGKPADWTGPGFDRLKVASDKVDQLFKALGLADE